MGKAKDERQRAATGARGEQAAARHLASLGYRILERNLRVGDDEADIVALTPEGAVAVIEVKARFGPWRPEERVDRVKRARLVRLAASLAASEPFRERLFQFDVVAVNLGTGGVEHVEHWPHAFDADGAPW